MQYETSTPNSYSTPCLPVCLNKQRGAALLVSLFILLMLSVFAIVGARTAALQQRMSANLQQQHSAFQAAENGIQVSILWLRGNREEWFFRENYHKDFCATQENFADWNDCSNFTDAVHYYKVNVKRYPCEDNSNDGCFEIHSTGAHSDAYAIHKQAHFFRAELLN